MMISIIHLAQNDPTWITLGGLLFSWGLGIKIDTSFHLREFKVNHYANNGIPNLLTAKMNFDRSGGFVNIIISDAFDLEYEFVQQHIQKIKPGFEVLTLTIVKLKERKQDPKKFEYVLTSTIKEVPNVPPDRFHLVV